MAEFEEALGETRASVTEEMEREYEQIQGSLKQDAHSAGGIGFIAPGMLTPRGPKGPDESASAVQPARPSISAPVARNGSGRPMLVERTPSEGAAT